MEGIWGCQFSDRVEGQAHPALIGCGFPDGGDLSIGTVGMPLEAHADGACRMQNSWMLDGLFLRYVLHEGFHWFVV